jgi:outer membrane protein
MSAMHRLKPLALGLLLACFAAGSPAADLMQAYELARVSDPQLGIADASRLATGEGVPQARSALLPQLSGEAGLTDIDRRSQAVEATPNADGSLSFGPSRSNTDNRDRNYTVNLRQTIYDRANYTRLRANRARAQRADYEYELAVDTLKLRVSEAYFRVLTAIDTLAFARAERRAVKRQLDQADQRFEVGLTAITDVHEARARYDGARANAIAAANSLDDAREALAEITGRYLANFRGLGEDFNPQLPTPAKADDWVALAVANNPSLRARELNLVAAGHDVATARAGHLPSLGSFVRWGDAAGWGTREVESGFEFPTDSSSRTTTVGLTLNVPIFSGGLTQSQVRQALYNRDLTSDQLEQERRAVVRQTRTNYRAVETGIAQIGALEQALVSARSALEATEAGFEVGTRTIVDVLLSQQQLFNAQRNYSEARHNFLLNGLRLRQAAGTIEVKDLQDVNRFLVADAEAKLEGTEEELDEAGY